MKPDIASAAQSSKSGSSTSLSLGWALVWSLGDAGGIGTSTSSDDGVAPTFDVDFVCECVCGNGWVAV